MTSNNINYNFEKSEKRIDNILDTSDTSFQEVEKIPLRDKLTFTNGFYVPTISALFVDIRSSSNLPSIHKKSTLAKIYRSYISECVAVINDNIDCAEINIHGDSVWGVFNAKHKSQIDGIFTTALQISLLIKTLNCNYKKRKIEPIKVGIGIDLGEILMIKAGYSVSNINEVVWMGDVINQASKLCSYGNKMYSDKEIMCSPAFYKKLNKDNKKLLSYNNNRKCYHGD